MLSLLAGENETLVICAMCWCQLPKLLLVVAWESAGGGQERERLGDQRFEILSHYGNNRDFREVIWAACIWGRWRIYTEIRTNDKLQDLNVLERAQG